MHASIKAYLLENGIDPEEVSKIERGEKSHHDALRKAAERAAESHPAMVKVREMASMLDDMKKTVEQILKCDREREARDRGIELFNKGYTNGHAIDLPNFLKGLRP
jgi:hypothetical protein